MTCKMKKWVREIRCRTRQYRKQRETRLFSCLTVCSLFLHALFEDEFYMKSQIEVLKESLSSLL